MQLTTTASLIALLGSSTHAAFTADQLIADLNAITTASQTVAKAANDASPLRTVNDGVTIAESLGAMAAKAADASAGISSLNTAKRQLGGGLLGPLGGILGGHLPGGVKRQEASEDVAGLDDSADLDGVTHTGGLLGGLLGGGVLKRQSDLAAGVAGAAPGVAGAVPGVAGAAPGVVGVAPGIVGAAAGVARDVPDVAGAAPAIVGDAPATVGDVGDVDDVTTGLLGGSLIPGILKRQFNPAGVATGIAGGAAQLGAQGAAGLTGGAAQLGQGALQGAGGLAGGAAQIGQGAAQLGAQGAAGVAGGAAQLGQGAVQGAGGLAGGAAQIGQGAAQLGGQGAASLAGGAAQLGAGIPKRQTAVSGVTGNVPATVVPGVKKGGLLGGSLLPGILKLRGGPSARRALPNGDSPFSDDDQANVCDAMSDLTAAQSALADDVASRAQATAGFSAPVNEFVRVAQEAIDTLSEGVFSVTPSCADGLKADAATMSAKWTATIKNLAQ